METHRVQDGSRGSEGLVELSILGFGEG
jgi:hypothetical protein